MDNKALTPDDPEVAAIPTQAATEEKALSGKSPPSGGPTEQETRVPVDPNVRHAGKRQAATAPYAGMGKEDLLRFSQTPFWNRVRLVCLVIFWLSWLGLLVAIIALTIVIPRCTAPPDQNWWQRTVIYDVYVPSFYDTNGDGMGDINGIAAKLEYLRSLNVDTILLSSIYLSNDEENSDLFNDVINHTMVDPRLGSMDDLKQLIETAHKQGMKVVLDFVPNHTSKKHRWFQESRKSDDSKDNPYWNYYIWTKCNSSSDTPNNWLTVYGQPAWAFDSQRSQCYFHNFLAEEPELNLRSSGVQEELVNVLLFWLKEANVDGFRVRSASFLYEDADLRDEPKIEDNCLSSNAYRCLRHTRTRGQEENYYIVSQWRDVLQRYQSSDYRVLMVESFDGVNMTAAFYGGTALIGANLPININLAKAGASCGGTCVHDLVQEWMTAMPSGAIADWSTSSSEIGRVGSDLDTNFRSAALMLKMTLPGTILNYFGEELGMINGNRSMLSVDPIGKLDQELSRDAYRTPMQWSTAPNAGFTNSSGGPWLPPNDDYPNINVQMQGNSTESLLFRFRSLTQLRMREGALQYGNFAFVVVTSNIVSYVREYNGQTSFLVAINFGSEDSTENYSTAYSSIPGEAEVEMTTTDTVDAKKGEVVSLASLRLRPYEGVIVKWPYTR